MKMLRFLLLVYHTVLTDGASFISLPFSGQRSVQRQSFTIETGDLAKRKTLARNRSFFGSPNDWNGELSQLIENETNTALIEALVCPNGESDALLQLSLVGRSSLQTTQNDTISCLVLSPTAPGKGVASSCLILPLSSASSESQLKLLSFAYAKKLISKSVCLALNSILVNRDDGLFDELPWSSWSIDPQLRNRDAAGNIIDAKYHLGKRDAYNRFMGKDWQGRSASLGNLALRLKYALEENQNQVEDTDSTILDMWEEDSVTALAKRILQLKIREMQMELAESDYDLAVARTNSQKDDVISDLEDARKDCQFRLSEARDTLASLEKPEETPQERDGLLVSALNRVVEWSTDSGRNTAPYRGAIGYAPSLDTQDEVAGSNLPYASPYDLLKEVIGDQLNADIIGVVLENTNVFDETVMLGGALILRRKTDKKTVTIDGEEVQVDDEEEDFGNPDGEGGETMLVECDADEAVGVALAYDIPIRLESQIWERSNMFATLVPGEDEESTNVFESIPQWNIENRGITFLVEGQGRNASDMTQVSPLRIPKTTTSMFDALFESSESSPTATFPTDNPIQSLSEFDELTNQDKAITLRSLSNFQGKLPRPRVIRDAESRGKNLLDEQLMPFIDESVRNQYLIRDAEKRQDYEAVAALKLSKSRRQMAKEKAEEAREAGLNDVAQKYDDAANFYDNLRADVTQDEGSYSRFLDKDELYERDVQARAKRTKKENFGTLLDGIE